MITVAAPTRVWQRLRAAPDGPREVVHAGAAALYVDLDGDVVGLLSATATRVPCGLWSRQPDLTDLARREVRVSGGRLVVGDVPVRISRLADVRVAPLAPRSRLAPDDGGSRPLPDLDLPADGRLSPADVARLVGHGPGLTPLGDDVLAGWLVTRVAAGAPDPTVADAVRRLRGRTTGLSGTLLDCALRGEALPELRTWLTALGTPAEPMATEALERVGATSGTGLLTGAALALRSLAAHHIDHPGRVA
ncbi:oxamate carbamoyltransferase subunit AllH family protein [Nocardioides sediminis]|uniref:oxamate carbamoyltransferase subunit AllH family protein n=1 Tax=Nocardioides sediminis TaxID=433648 RepID=UPI00131EF6FE|nr:DUF2877 domain-containing protein [Nocardioides sediminis]